MAQIKDFKKYIMSCVFLNVRATDEEAEAIADDILQHLNVSNKE